MTILPDGTILLVGGMDSSGQVAAQAEIFHPDTGQITPLSSPGISAMARAYHTATLLTDGHVLIAGGVSSSGQVLNTALLWDFKTQSLQELSSPMIVARQGHTATLLADGTVLLWGGTDPNGATLGNGEIYDPVTQTFTLVTTKPPLPQDQSGPPQFMGSNPESGATGVPVDVVIGLRFSKLLLSSSVNSNSVTLSGPEGTVSGKVVAVDSTILIFLSPNSSLQTGTTYTVSVSGVTDQAGLPAPDTSITFSTAGENEGGGASGAGGDLWIPDASNMRGDWKSHRPDSPWQKLPPLIAAPGVTAVSGQLLTLSGKPLPQVTLKIGDQTTFSDDTGRFLLENIPADRQILLIDGRTASSPGKTYGTYKVGVDVTAAKTNVLPDTSWMPLIDTAHAVSFISPNSTEVIVTTPHIPGLELDIPVGSVMTDIDGKPVTSISITAIPVDRTPFPLPVGVNVPVYFTIQPGGAYIGKLSYTAPHGAQIVYPNFTSQPPGSLMNFWNYEPQKGWSIYGQSKVSANGKQVLPDPKVSIYEFTGSMLGGSGTAPSTGGTAGGAKGGEPVDLATGLFIYEKTDLVLPDVIPIVLTRTYRPNDTTTGDFGKGSRSSFGMYLVGDTTNWTYADLILPDGGRIHYTNTVPNSGFWNAVFVHTGTPTKFTGSTITWCGCVYSDWHLTFKDGTIWYLADNGGPLFQTADRYGNILSISRSGSFGQGQISRITSPNGRTLDFTYTNGVITRVQDNIGRTVQYIYDPTYTFLTQVIDANGGTTIYHYDANNRMDTITDPRNIKYLTNSYDPTTGRISQQTLGTGTLTYTYTFNYITDSTGEHVLNLVEI